MGVRERRRQALIDAARELFIERGVEQVTVDDIADRCEITRRSFYRYFASRDHVALAVEIELIERWAALLADLSEKWRGSGASQLRQAFADLESLVDDHADEVRFTRVFDEQRGGAEDPALANQLAAAVGQLLAPLTEVLRHGEADGTLRLGASPALTASTLTNAYLGLAQRVYGFGDRLAREQDVEPRAMLTELSRMYVAGLASTPQDR